MENNIVKSIFEALAPEVSGSIYMSPDPLTVKDDRGVYKSYYGFMKTGAIRLDLTGSTVKQVAVWNKPESLIKPDFLVQTETNDIDTIIYIISNVLYGKANRFLKRDSMFSSSLNETAKDDIEEFFDGIGTDSYQKDMTQLYNAYLTWADIYTKRIMSFEYFSTLVRQWSIRNNKGPFSGIEVKKNDKKGTIQYNPSLENLFKEEILENPIMYKANLYESIIRKIADNDPKIISLFACGSPNSGKDKACEEILKKKRVWESRVVLRDGDVAGFTDLILLLWRNRNRRIIILKNSDPLLLRESSLSILKNMFSMTVDDNTIYYNRTKKKKDKSNEK